MEFFGHLLVGAFAVGLFLGVILMIQKKFVHGICTFIGAFLLAWLAGWMIDPDGSKEAAREAIRQEAKNPPPPSASPYLRAAEPEVTPVLTLKNYEAGRDVSIQCRGYTGNVKCYPVK